VLNKHILLRASYFLLIAVFTLSHTVATYAISEEQRRLFNKNILYFNLDCSIVTTDTNDETIAEVDGTTQELAQAMLSNPNITYWTNAPESPAADWASRVPSGGNTTAIDTKDVVRALAEGKRAYTTAGNASNKYAVINPNILKFILEASASGSVMVNALTDKTHTTGSAHYRGLAVDIDKSIDLSILTEPAAKYGGTKNSETDHHHFDFPERPKGSDASIAADPTSPRNAVYFLGDSIGANAQTLLEQKYKDRDLESYFNTSEGRSVKKKGSTDGFETSGLTALDDDKAKIQNSGSVVIQLGTTPDSNPKEAITELVKKVKEINQTATIYWVNVFSKSSKKKEVNQAIIDASADEKFRVIDTTNAEIPLESDNINPTNEGLETFAETVVSNSAEIEAKKSATKSGNCSCGGSSVDSDASLSGSDNAEKTWNYFIGKGLKPEQVAGIMGNIAVESHFEPSIVQGGAKSSNIPMNATQGYGLVQWTDIGRKNKFVERAKEQGAKHSSLSFQLDHIWWELNNTEKGSFDALKKTTKVGGANEASLSSAWYVFSKLYERPAAPANPERGTQANKYLSLYGSNSGGGGGGDSTSSGGTDCSEDASGTVSGEYSLPLDKKWYDQNKEWFTKPHHDYAASDIPIPTGTKVYSMTAGKVIKAPVGGACGIGVIIDDPNGVRYTYCHGTDGGSVAGAKNGDTVKPGQLIMHSGNTGESSGPHLHVQIKVSGQLKCPQTLFTGISEGKPPAVSELPSSGCSY
jgi:murein DD-endopeptidase MepM/ murein hydrolase activator NlpD